MEKKIFFETVQKNYVTGREGDLEIYLQYTNLLTSIKPGIIRITKKFDE
ncbi:MAG: hypothetical protein ACEY29_02805 [Arsenophonus sp.]